MNDKERMENRRLEGITGMLVMEFNADTIEPIQKTDGSMVMSIMIAGKPVEWAGVPFVNDSWNLPARIKESMLELCDNVVENLKLFKAVKSEEQLAVMSAACKERVDHWEVEDGGIYPMFQQGWRSGQPNYQNLYSIRAGCSVNDIVVKIMDWAKSNDFIIHVGPEYSDGLYVCEIFDKNHDPLSLVFGTTLFNAALNGGCIVNQYLKEKDSDAKN